ncbi:CKLF-like MARVEL transmembrane domain-containing protein 6 [Phoenicopterus ruber ruber]
MENGAVYGETTEPEAKVRRRPFGCTLRHLWGWRLPAKAFQAILSLVAVICEEIVEDCIKCGGLYFFEFTSCSAFLLSLLILFVYCTDVYDTFGEDKVQKVNHWAVPVIGLCFLLASIVLAATSSGSPVEKAACVFGFFASGAFLAEIITELVHMRKQNINGRSENPGNTETATESRPLNKPS